MNRRLRSTLPATNKQLKPKCTNMDTTKEKFQKSKLKQKQYYDRSAKPMQKLNAEDTVRVQFEKGGKWRPAKVISYHKESRSYQICTPEGAESDATEDT